jgi:hypothetical protein
LAVAGAGYATTVVTATTTANGTTGTFFLIITSVTPVNPPSNIVTFSTTGLNTPSVMLQLAMMVYGETLLMNYTVKDAGTIAATDVEEGTGQNLSFKHCDSYLTTSLYGTAPSSLAGGASFKAQFEVTDNLLSGPVQAGCSDPYSAQFYLNVTAYPAV